MDGGVVPSFCSRSSSSSSSSSLLPKTPRRTMEEVWKEISLSSDHRKIPLTPFLSASSSHQHEHQQYQSFTAANPTTTSTSFRGTNILQDFLSGSIKQSITNPLAAAPLADPQPPTGLSLHCGHLMVNSSSNGSSISDLSACSDAISKDELEIKRQKQLDGSFDRRKKRMIKNRESAARSRARKQAYTHELEREVAHLTDENKEIKRKYEELAMAMAAHIPPTMKPMLQRTTTAPF